MGQNEEEKRKFTKHLFFNCIVLSNMIKENIILRIRIYKIMIYVDNFSQIKSFLDLPILFTISCRKLYLVELKIFKETKYSYSIVSNFENNDNNIFCYSTFNFYIEYIMQLSFIKRAGRFTRQSLSSHSSERTLTISAVTVMRI